MKKSQITVGELYYARVSGRLCVVQILRPAGDGLSGWTALNTATGREIRIRSAARLTPYCGELQKARP